MNESLRQAYLQVMGIQSYFPRVPVPGAKVSPEYVLDTPVHSVVINASGKQPAGKMQPAYHLPPAALKVSNEQRRPTGRITAKVDLNQTPAPVEAAATTPSSIPSAAANQLRFRLHYYRISNALAVIDEVPYQQQEKTSDAVMSLLLAIMQALGEHPGSAVVKADQFDWPLESGIEVKGNPVLAAQQALHGYIAMRKQRDGFQQLLVFSSQLPTLLLEDQAGVGKNSGKFDQFAASGNYHITVTHSLQSLLAHPILKRETWEHLQPLRQRLGSLRN